MCGKRKNSLFSVFPVLHEIPHIAFQITDEFKGVTFYLSTFTALILEALWVSLYRLFYQRPLQQLLFDGISCNCF